MLKAKAVTQRQVDARTAREERERVNAESERYLKDTDWMVIRAAERLVRLEMRRSGETVPIEFDEREAARTAIVREVKE